MFNFVDRSLLYPDALSCLDSVHEKYNPDDILFLRYFIDIVDGKHIVSTYDQKEQLQ